MQNSLSIYNTLSKKKEVFKAVNQPYVGMYVCGPTVYSNAHLGNARTFISFDVIFRYLTYLGFKVRYVRNITDAGHLEAELEPMEIVQKYSVDFHQMMQDFNALPPSIEPTATGHIIEQIEMIKVILKSGYAYEVDGSIYFDVEKYNETQNYGVLNGRKLEDLINNTRDLGGQQQKKGKLDFALWIKAKPEHLMQWPSPWGNGFPGWHLECSAMSNKYLGEQFDIHGGGIDLVPTHHTNEIAQNIACCGKQPANYWVHTNMLTVNGQKMSKSLGNSFLPNELFSGNHPLLNKGHSPMVIRFFMLQAHYRSTLDFSNDALEASEKGFKRLMSAFDLLDKLKVSDTSEVKVTEMETKFRAAMDDDFNTSVLIAELFEATKTINSIYDGKTKIDQTSLEDFKKLMRIFVMDVLGLKNDLQATDDLAPVMDFILKIRTEAKENKDYITSDKIRIGLNEIGFQVKDGKDGSSWVKE
jgi:cysteinyl-tRNA synthetase